MSLLNRYFEDINSSENTNIAIAKNTIFELAILIIKTIVKNTYTLQTIFNKIPQPSIDVQKFELISHIEDYTIDFTDKILQHPEVTMLYSYSPKIHKAIIYIMDNFSRPIGAENIATELYITSSHLKHIFKKEKGKTFNEFLSEYRIKMAAQMILSGKYRLYEVSELVGYHDTRHFSKLFKKITGYVPSEYRSIEE